MRLSLVGMYRLAILAGLALMGSLSLFADPAKAIDVSLNLIYSNPANPLSGGNWQIVAKSEGFGISSLNLWFDGVSVINSTAPFGTVNGAMPAGFAIRQSSLFDEDRNAVVGQIPNTTGSGEQTLFYGVGTLVNGSPDFPGKPAGSNSVGPAFTTLSGVNNVPWANVPDFLGNATWNTAAKLWQGTFSAGATPDFITGPGRMSTGTVFSSLGSPTSPGAITSSAINTFVRSNLIITTGDADYNNDGTVDAADYTVWRNMLGQTGTGLAADGAGPGGPGVPDGVVNQLDYDFWKTNYGQTVPGSGSGLSGGTNVPEPAGFVLFALAAACATAMCRFSRPRGLTLLA